jgi:hypothetical protein
LDAAGDLEYVRARLRTATPDGAGAQRAAAARRGSVEDVVDDLLARTERSWRD